MSDENFDLIYEVFFRTPRKSARAANSLSDFISTAHSILRRLRISQAFTRTHQRSATIYRLLRETLRVSVAGDVCFHSQEK